MRSKNKNPFDRDTYLGETRLKWIILLGSAMLAAASIYYTHTLVGRLKQRESAHVQLYAKALEYALNNDNSGILFATEEVIYKNNSIPTILTDERDSIVFFENLNMSPTLSKAQRSAALKRQLERMREAYPPIEIELRDPNTGEAFGKQLVYYRNSHLLTRLTVYSYVQFAVLAVLGLIAYMAFSYSKADEQNRLWIGLAKETAHQLGTPLSSLMAWVETLRETDIPLSYEIADELDKDVKKLRMVTERFSSIGSPPPLRKTNVYRILSNVQQYLQPRISTNIRLRIEAVSKGIEANIHAPLLEWVIEVLCKNAVDAMEGDGDVAIRLGEADKKHLFIDVVDTGKGISKSLLPHIFAPGFTTKKHGWGLGLALSRRIVERYHKGRIAVLYTDADKGTAFRIVLKKEIH